MEVVLLSQDGCNPCERVKRILADIQAGLPGIHVREVRMSSPEGFDLALEHQVLLPPAVFVDGRLLASGKIYPEPLRAALLRAQQGISA